MVELRISESVVSFVVKKVGDSDGKLDLKMAD